MNVAGGPTPEDQAPGAVAVLDPAPAPAPLAEATRRRLSPLIPADPMSWVWTAVIAFVAATLRLVNLSYPKGQIFDEQHYVPNATTMLDHGVEWDATNNNPAFIVHPPLGKWCIALGEQLFGRNEFGWRLPSVVAGVVAVIVITRLARRMFGSTVLGCAAGLLMALDGMQFVLARSALLDIFLMTFLVGSFACLVADRESRRHRWLTSLSGGLGHPRFQVPWWRIGSALLMGCAMSVKWSAVYYLVAFILLFLAWEVGARRSAGLKNPVRDGLLDELGWAFAYGFAVIGVYLASWTGWFATDGGYDRHWLRANGKPEIPFIGAIQNLIQYHNEMLGFHNSLVAKHIYQSWPSQWLLLGRPVAFYWSGDGNCGGGACASEILLLGTPLLWWAFIPALLAAVWIGVSRRDWRAWPIVIGSLAGIVPWFFMGNRTMFYFYALPSEPFLILAVVLALGAIIGKPTDSPNRRLTGTIIAGSYVGIVAICFAYFYPIYTGQTLQYASWWARMWLGQHWV